MTTEQKYSPTSKHGNEILMFITCFIIVISTLPLFYFKMRPLIGFIKINRTTSDQVTNLFLSMGYAVSLPLMSYNFSKAMQSNQDERAQVILSWMVLIEIIRIHGASIFRRRQQKLAHQLAGLFWVGFLVYSYTPQKGMRMSLFVLCIEFAVHEVLKGIMCNKAKDSYLIGKNPKLIHNYQKKVILKDDGRTTPMNRCDYIVMGEENHEIVISSNGYQLGKMNSNSEGFLTIGRVFQLNSPDDEVFYIPNPSWRDTCLSLALAKMLRRRFAKLPVIEVGCTKALDFVLEGLIDYIGNNRDTQTDGNDGERNPTERVFSIIQEELKFVSDFLHTRVPIYHYFGWCRIFDLMGVIGLSHVASHYWVLISWIEFSNLDRVITLFLTFAFVYIQQIEFSSVSETKRWSILTSVKTYIKNPEAVKQGIGHEQNVKEARVYSSVLDAEAESIFFCIKVSVPIIARLPKLFRKIIPISSPTVLPSTDAKEAILRSLRNSGGRLTNGETSLKKYGMTYLSSFCHPNDGTTKAILVWHIATTLFHHKESSAQQNNNSFKEKEVALVLSNYCHYLVAYFPQLIPDERTEEMYEIVTKEILSIALLGDHTKINRCNYALEAKWDKGSLVGKSVRLVEELIFCAKQGKQVVKMLSEFWAEMMLFIAPSDNVKGHEEILNQGELITQLWALLTHAGIHTEQHKSRINPASILTWSFLTKHNESEMQNTPTEHKKS